MLKNPLPSYLEDMGDARCFVDVDVPARPAVVPDGDAEFTIPKDISSFLTGLTPEGYLFDEHGENSQEKDFSFLQDVYGGACILLKESETLKGGVDDLCLVLRTRIKQILEYQLVKLQSIPCDDEPDLERYAFVQLTAEAAKSRKLVWELSPSTAVYIPIDVFCTYVSTSYIRSTSSTSRLSSGYGDGTAGILAGRRCELYALFPAPAGRPPEPGAAKPPQPGYLFAEIRSMAVA